MTKFNLTELQNLLDSAQRTEANGKEIRKSLARIENFITGIVTEVQQVHELLDGNAVLKRGLKTSSRGTNSSLGEALSHDEDAPYGRKADGSPKKRPGRSKGDKAIQEAG